MTSASGPKPDRAGIRIPPPVIPLVFILLGWLLNKMMPLPMNSMNPYIEWIGWAVIVPSIVLLGVWPVSIFRKHGESENPFKPTHKVLTSGPYRFTRNPMYLMMVLICIGAGFLQNNLWQLILAPLVAGLLFWFAIRHEERYLEAKFGEAYLEYKQQVRRWI